MPVPDPVLSARGRLGRAHWKSSPPGSIDKARAELKTELLARDIAVALETAPPLTGEQRARLAMLLMGAKS